MGRTAQPGDQGRANDRPLRRPLLAAPVSGYPALEIARLLDRHLPDLIARRQGAQFHPDLIADLRQQWAAIRDAGEQWLTWRVAADESTEAAPVETEPISSQEITPEQASVLLQVTPSRVRQLLRARELEGRKVGRQWLTSREAIEDYRVGRQAEPR